LNQKSDVNEQEGTHREDLLTALSNGAIPLEGLDKSICNMGKILRIGIASTIIDLSP
jgi:hypothetical protein